jgi:hypothetical protein
MATISVSTTSSAITLSGQTAVFLSGNYAAKVYLVSTGTALTSGSTYSVGSGSGSCDTKYFQIQVDDLNDNPMPAGTTIAVANLNHASAGSVLPSTVPSVAPHTSAGVFTVTPSQMAARQGSIHTIPIILPAATSTAGDACIEGGTADAAAATFDISITAPHGENTTIFGVKITYPH